MVYLLWFVKEMAEGQDDEELLIGVYSSESEARAAIERVRNKRGFAEFQDGLQICPYQLDRDHWTEGFVVE
jgi:hypothetical protein